MLFRAITRLAKVREIKLKTLGAEFERKKCIYRTEDARSTIRLGDDDVPGGRPAKTVIEFLKGILLRRVKADSYVLLDLYFT